MKLNIFLQLETDKPPEVIRQNLVRLIESKGGIVVSSSAEEVDTTPFTDDDIMLFGSHKGKKMRDVPARYLDWLRDQAWLSKWPRIKAYIEKNESVIDQELNDIPF